jgi:hypothetical protein
MEPAAVIAMQPPPGPVMIAPYARHIQLHFRWTAILAAVLHVGLLVLFAGKGVSRLAASVISIAYFLLFLNLLVLARVGWSLFSARTRTTAGLLFLASLASLLLWMVPDTDRSLPAAVAYPAAALALIAWLGALFLLHGVVTNADGLVEDAMKRGGVGFAPSPTFATPAASGATQALGQVAAASVPVMLPPAPVPPVITAPVAAPVPAPVAAPVPAPVAAVPIVASPGLPSPFPAAAAPPTAVPPPPPTPAQQFWKQWFGAGR